MGVDAAPSRFEILESEMLKKHMFATTVLAVFLGSAAMAGVERIKEIDVTADVAALQNENAAAYWATLEADLEAAIALRVTDRMDDDGARISIDIREIELASAFDRVLNLGDAVLVGQVNISDETNHSNYNAYELSVSLEVARVIVPEGQTVVLNADDRASYQALVDTFAQGVVDRLD
jgi:hypothetical protein